MPKIVLSTDKTTWVGFELYPGDQYISFDDVRFEIPKSDIILEPTSFDLSQDIETYLKIEAYSYSPVFKKICRMLCEQKYTNGQCIYFTNSQAEFGVSKCLNPDVKYVVK